MTPRLVLFDCDGVLVDSEPITNEIIRSNLSRNGLSLEPEQIISMFVGGTIVGVGEKAAKMGADISDSWVDDIYKDMYRQLAISTPLISGIELVLEQLDAANISYAVGSNGPLEKMQITLGQHPLLWARLKGQLYSAHVHAKPKPAPDLYLYAAKAMGVSPRNCVVVDDSPAGCLGASNAGIKCFGYAAHDNGTNLAEVGAEVFHQMPDLTKLLGLPAIKIRRRGSTGYETSYST